MPTRRGPVVTDVQMQQHPARVHWSRGQDRGNNDQSPIMHWRTLHCTALFVPEHGYSNYV